MTARWTQRNPRWTWLAAVAALLFVDQISKSYFSTTLALGKAVGVTEWLNFVHVLNTLKAPSRQPMRKTPEELPS